MFNLILNGNAVAPLQHVGKLLWRNLHRATHQLGDVIALHELAMIVWIPLRQFERLRTLALSVDVSNERTCVAAIVTSAAEHHPAAVARP